MSKNKKPAAEKLPFDNRGGVIVISMHLFKSAEYKSLSIKARFLMLLLQQHWRNDKPVAFGVREAADELNCHRNKATLIFNELMQSEFIKMYAESEFNTHSGNKARSWILTWMPFKGKPPTNDWEKSH